MKRRASGNSDHQRHVRKVNGIAHYALTAAALDDAQQVNDAHLHAALEELRP